jgi:ferritin-like protein
LDCGSSEAIDEAGGGTALRTSRASFIRRAAVVGAAAVGGGSLLEKAWGSDGAAPSAAQDAKVFNFALALEYLQAQARARPRFDFRGATDDERRFLPAAVILENTGVAAYNGQVANLTDKALTAAAEIVSVEGRHAAWISDLAGVEPAPRAADRERVRTTCSRSSPRPDSSTGHEQAGARAAACVAQARQPTPKEVRP